MIASDRLPINGERSRKQVFGQKGSFAGCETENRTTFRKETPEKRTGLL